MKKILLLDSPDLETFPGLSRLCSLGNVEVITEECIGNQDEYQPTPIFLSALEEYVRENAFDLIIVGHNDGAGIQKVAAIGKADRAKIVVASNESLAHEVRGAYEKLGCKKFARRHLLTGSIIEEQCIEDAHGAS